jgi:transcriptional regulator with XRE-family HTH domain
MKKKELTSLGKRIKYLRGDLTQSEFADILRIKQAMISRYEADKETPSPKVLLRIGLFSGKSIEWLLTGEDMLSPRSSNEPVNVKLMAAKITKNLSKKEMVEVAAGYLRDTKNQSALEFIDMMRDLFQDKKRMREVLHHYRFIRFQENDRSGK